MHVLLFSYELGPSGHTGGFRWNHLIRELSQMGWSFDVVTSAESFAATQGSAYGEQVEIHPVPADWLGRRIRRRVGRVRPPPSAAIPKALDPADLRIRDVRRPPAPRQRVADAVWGAYHTADGYLWARRAGGMGLDLAKRRRPDLVVATLPEWLVPLAALRVARATGVPLVLDLRDPWYFGRGDYASMLDDVQRRVWRASEIRATRAAALVIDNTNRALVAARDEVAPYAQASRVAITNAHPLLETVGKPDPERFVVAFVGYLYPFMDPRPLLAACGRLKLRHRLGSETFAVRFVGTGEQWNGTSLAGLAAAYGLAGSFAAEDRVAAPVAQAIMEASAALVVFDFPHGLQTPSKFYLYAQMHGHVVAIAADGSALADAARQVGIEPVPAGDDTALDQALDAAFAAWRSGSLGQCRRRVEPFLATNTAKQMDQALRQAIAAGVGHDRGQAK